MLVILTAVDPSQLPRLRFPRFILISKRVVFSAVYGIHTPKLPSTEFCSGPRRPEMWKEDEEHFANNSVKVHAVASRMLDVM